MRRQLPLPLKDHLQAVADEILLFARGDGVAIALSQNGELRCRAASGIAPPLGARIDARSGLTGACLDTGTLLRCDDSEQDTRVDRQVCRTLGIRAMVCVPISAGREVVGIFEVFSSQPNAFLKVDPARLHAKAEEIANCFEAEEALARAADADARAAPTKSWTPAPHPATRPARLPASSKRWQAALGILVLALGLFLVLRAVRGSGPPTSAWITPQPASAAAMAVQPAEEEISDRRTAPQRLRQRAQPPPAAVPAPALVVPSAASSVAHVRNSNDADSAPLLPPHALAIPGAPDGNALTELVSSVPAAQPSLSENLRVSTGVPQPILVHRVEPAYPAFAKQGGIEGQVVLEALVNASGRVTGLRVAKGNNLLADAAQRAVRQWRYRPPRLNGQPVEIPIKIILNFELRK